MKVNKKTVISGGAALVGVGAILATSLAAANKVGEKKKEKKLIMMKELNNRYTHCDISVKNNKYLISKGIFAPSTLDEKKTVKLGYLQATDIDINRSHFAVVKIKTEGPLYTYQILDTRTMTLVDLNGCTIKEYEWQEDKLNSKLIVVLHNKEDVQPFIVQTSNESFYAEKDIKNEHLFRLTLFAQN